MIRIIPFILLAAIAAACPPPAVEPPPADPCVDKPTTAVQLLEDLSTLRGYPGESITLSYRIDARGADGVLEFVPGEVEVIGSGRKVGETGESVRWQLGLQHGTFDARIGRLGCPDDFILAKVQVVAPAAQAVGSEPSGDVGGSGLAWSPDSKNVAVASQDLLRVYDKSGRYVRGVRTGLLGYHQEVAWSADGQWIAVAGDDGRDRGPLLLKADRLQPWTRFPTDRGFGVAFDPATQGFYALDVLWHPGQGVSAAQLLRLDLADASTRTLAAGAGAGDPSWGVTVDDLVIHAGTLSQKRDNHAMLRRFGCGEERIGQRVSPHAASGLVYVHARNGVCAVNPATGDEVRFFSVPMDAPRALALDPLGEGFVAAGRACAPSASSCSQASIAVWKGTLGGELGLSSRFVGQEFKGAAWSPDGAYLAYTFDDGTGFEVVPRVEVWTHWGTP